MKTVAASPLLTILILLAACATSRDAPATVTTRSGLTYEVVEEGTGPAARPGQHVLIHETTRRKDGSLVYSTEPGPPLRFLLGGKQVIDGVDEGVTGMRVGERRKMVVPPALSRRSIYPDHINPNDTLYYDVRLVGIEASSQSR